MIFSRVAASSMSMCETPPPEKRFFRLRFSFKSSARNSENSFLANQCECQSLLYPTLKPYGCTFCPIISLRRPALTIVCSLLELHRCRPFRFPPVFQSCPERLPLWFRATHSHRPPEFHRPGPSPMS